MSFTGGTNAVFTYRTGNDKDTATLSCYLPKTLKRVMITDESNIACGAFEQCSCLTNIVLNDGITSVGDFSFSECSGLTSIEVPEGVTNIGNSAFRDCVGLVSLVVPDSVVSIGQYAFQGCSSLSEVDIPASVRIGYKAFDGCPAEENITYTDVAPQIRNVTAKQRYPWNGKVDITFEVVGDVTAGLAAHDIPALTLVAIDRTTGAKFTAKESVCYGDVGYAEGPHHVIWDMGAQGLVCTSGEMMFTVAYETAEYCIIDLSAGSNASSYTVKYLADKPVGGWTDEYKTTKLALRLIMPGSFTGKPFYGDSYTVAITKAHYCGVFEITQKQYELIMGSKPSSFTGDTLPVEKVSYNAIRGSSNGSKWPSASTVDSSSFIGRLRARTGLDFDLPTEAQWEYACRAGTVSAYYWGDTLNGSYVWYSDNSGKVTHPVGTKRANAWGLYDMSGNVSEWCLDWYGSLSNKMTDPVGPSSGSERVLRGDNFRCQYANNYFSSSSRSKSSPAYVKDYVGLRVVVNL